MSVLSPLALDLLLVVFHFPFDFQEILKTFDINARGYFLATTGERGKEHEGITA